MPPDNRNTHLVLILLGTAGIILLFFPFASGYDVRDGWEWLGRFMYPSSCFYFRMTPPTQDIGWLS